MCVYVCVRVSFGLRSTKECSMTYRQSETYNQKIHQKLTTTVSFIRKESLCGRQISQTDTDRQISGRQIQTKRAICGSTTPKNDCHHQKGKKTAYKTLNYERVFLYLK